MNDSVSQTLKQLVAQYGNDLCTNRQKLEGLLRDLCGQHRREVNVLVAAVREGVAEQLLNASGKAVDPFLADRLVQRLQEEAGMQHGFAVWGVTAWAEALGKELSKKSASAPSQMIEIQCPNCGKTGKVPAEKIGQQVRCSCGHVFVAQPVSKVENRIEGQVRTSPPPPAPQVKTVEYAGFWRRAAAAIIDTVILWVIGSIGGGVVGAIIGGMMGASGASRESIFSTCGVVGYIVRCVLGWLYFTMLESSEKQATYGKMALGIVVTDLQGQRISFAIANGRYWGKIVSGIILCIGFIMAGYTEKKQALHDTMAGCLVVMK